jgi:hypothetical protein
MRVGTLCFATDQGLGYLAKAFYDNGVVTDVMVVDHPTRPCHMEWYPGAGRMRARPMDIERVVEWAKELDVMLFFETPFDWRLFTALREAKVLTVLMVMYECMPEVWPAKPDRTLSPSLLDAKYYPNSIYIPVPVDMPWKQRETVETFVHNGGNLGLRGRNGTQEVVNSWPYVKSDAKLIVRTQVPVDRAHRTHKGVLKNADSRVTFVTGTVPRAELYATGDVFLFPEKFNGLSLPLQEACASGMLVMASARFPNTKYLPTEPLVPVKGYKKTRVGPPYNIFMEAIIDPQAIAAKVDEWYGRDIRLESYLGKRYAEENSWEKLKPRYLEALS